MKKTTKLSIFLLTAIIFSMTIFPANARSVAQDILTPTPDYTAEPPVTTTPPVASRTTTTPRTEPSAMPANAVQPPHWAADPDNGNTDLFGNGQLIEEQHIVFESDLITFISVTTKAGNVFYIFIDHRIEDGSANVYFLTKVNEYDLLSILFDPAAAEKNDEEPPVHPNMLTPQNTVKPQYNTPVETFEPLGNEESGASDNQDKPPLIPTSSIIILGVVVIGGIGIAFYFFTSGKKNKGKRPEKDEYDDEDEDN